MNSLKVDFNNISDLKKERITGYILNDLANLGYLNNTGNDLLNVYESSPVTTLPADLVKHIYSTIALLFDDSFWGE